jgi:hypothetical protein
MNTIYIEAGKVLQVREYSGDTDSTSEKEDFVVLIHWAIMTIWTLNETGQFLGTVGEIILEFPRNSPVCTEE